MIGKRTRPTTKLPATKRGVVVFGEVLCDLFAPAAGMALKDAPHLIPRSGGAPSNVAVQLARLGVATTLVTAVGKDPFGARLTQGLQDEGVDVSCVVEKAGRRTGCTLVEVSADGERSFFGFRENSADLALDEADVAAKAVRAAVNGAAVVHTGTVSLRSPSSRRATAALHKAGRDAGALVSVDVNLRPGMFPSLPLLLRLANTAARAADVVKATREEAVSLRGKNAKDDVLADFLLDKGPRLALLTFGEEGSLLCTRNRRRFIAPVAAKTVDVTGAGDAYLGAALAWLVRHGVGVADVDELSDDELCDLGSDAAVCGAAVVTALGATSNMLTLDVLRAHRARSGSQETS